MKLQPKQSRYSKLLMITINILDYLLPATQRLQSTDLDVVKSVDTIFNLKSTIQNLRKFVDEYHNKWYNDALNLADEIDIKESDVKKT